MLMSKRPLAHNLNDKKKIETPVADTGYNTEWRCVHWRKF